MRAILLVIAVMLAGCGKLEYVEAESAKSCIDDLTIIWVDEVQRTTLLDQEKGGKHYRFNEREILGAVGDKISLCKGKW